jgi:omega-6 fatty acid desaturase (delta-12 desaturase)
MTPYQQWRHTHARHHATSGDLDRRGEGDIWTLTVDEYLKSPRWRRLAYRVVRNPLVLFVVAPLYLFIIRYRLPARGSMRRERLSVHGTNAALVGIVLVMALTIGWEAFLSIQLPVSMLSAAVGMWLFYVQHQFDGVYWARREKWDFAGAAVNGSSFYRLPKILQWFTGNIGFHHVHHLNPAIPNYNLERCHREQPMLRTVRPLTLFASLRSLTFRLWDEQRQRLVGYAGVRAARRERRRAATAGRARS